MPSIASDADEQDSIQGWI